MVTKHAANGNGSRSRYRKIKADGKSMGLHRYVAEQILDRKLTSVEEIHHSNGDTYDNRPDNLIYFPTGAAHLSYEKRRLFYLERCLQRGFLVWTVEPPPFDIGGVLLSELTGT